MLIGDRQRKKEASRDSDFSHPLALSGPHGDSQGVFRPNLRNSVIKISQAEFLKSVAHPSQLPTEDFPEVAFAGRSNVGKSSLINRLLNRRNLAKTSKAPGKTRTLNYYLINRRFHLVDLPGYGFAKRPLSERKSWANLIEAYLDSRAHLLGIVHLLDARHDPTVEDLDMVNWLCHGDRRFLVVATKVDKLSGSKTKKRLDQTARILSNVGDIPLLPFSATTGKGRSEVWDWIEDVIRN